jgi:outer membrane protein assembly factor BamB
LPGVLWAIDAATGAVRWQTPTPEEVSGGNVALANGVVYYVGMTGLQAFDAATGTPLWVAAVQGGPNPMNAAGFENPGDGVAIAGHHLVTTDTLGIITDWHLPS